MKKIPYYTARTAKAALGLFLGLACCAGFASCSDDDDKDGGVGGGSDDVKTCYFEADGERYDFGYAYLGAEFDTEDVGLGFYDIEILDYFYNPDKVKPGTYVNMAFVDFENCTEIPTGTIPSTGNEETGEVAFNFEMETHVDLYSVIYGTYEEVGDSSVWYTHDWSGKRPSQMKVTKTGDNSYRMECADMKLLSEYGGEGIGIESRQTTGSFFFDGTPTTMAEGRGTRSITVKTVDKDAAAWLKMIRERVMRKAE